MARIVSFSLNKETADLLEKIEEKFDFPNRSELIRSSLQLLLHEGEGLEQLKGHASAIVATIHHQNESDISRIKHQFNDIITTQVHSNLHGKCLELFVTHGRAETIVHFFKTLKQIKGVEYAKLVSTSL